jgi:lysophospholipase L1-like esterase
MALLPPGPTKAQFNAFRAQVDALNAARPLLATNRTMQSSLLQGAGANTLIREAGRYFFTVGAAGFSDVRIAFGNWRVTAGEQADSAPLTLAAYWEIASPAARVRPLTFGGARSITIQPGDTVWCDRLPGPFAGGSQIMLRLDLTVTSGQWPCATCYAGRISGEGVRQSDSTGTAQGGNTGVLSATNTLTGNFGFGPLAIVGTPLPTSAPAARRAVVLVGDSITWGNGDTADSYGSTGWAKGIIDAGGLPIPNAVLARDSEEARHQNESAAYIAWRKAQVFSYATAMFCGLGTNDIVSGQSLSAIQASLTAIWSRGKQYGLKVAQLLILPRQTAAATFTPMTGFASGGTRDQLNTWIRSQVGKGLLDAAVDAAALVEGTTPGTYKAGGITTDGTHMNAAGYTLAVPAVRAWAATL